MNGSSAMPGLRNLLVATLLVSLAPPLFADWIRLKGGVQVHGKIILETEERITLRSSKGTFSFDAKRVTKIHRTTPVIGGEKKKVEEDTTPPQQVTAKARELKLGDHRITVPLTFTLKRGRAKIPGYDGELLGIYEEKKTGALISVSRENSLPLEAKDLPDLAKRIRASLRDDEAITLENMKQVPIDSKPCLVVELTEERDGKKTRTIKAWMPDGSGCVGMAVSVPDRKYRLNSLRYSKILHSLQRR